MTKKINILESLESNICAENDADYSSQVLQPFYFNPKRKTKIYCGDALDILKHFPDKCIDMIFADPPYFGNQSGLIIKRTDGHEETFDTQKAQWAYSKPLAEQFQFHYSWIKEAQRILKDGSTIWISGTYHSIGTVNVVLQDLGFKILNDIILHKRNAPPNFLGSCFRAVTETLLWAKKNNKGENPIPNLKKADAYKGSILAGVDLIRQMLIGHDELHPKLMILDRPENQELIHSFRTLQRDTYANEDIRGPKDSIAEGKHDHHAALRYILQSPLRWYPLDAPETSGIKQAEEALEAMYA